jgi:hypothetical protein
MKLGKEQATGYAEDEVTAVADAASGEPGPVAVPESELERAPAG